MMNSRNNIKKRLFVVGTARSGTTLLQNMLASHPDIYSFPETHFFRGTVPKVWWLRLVKRYGSKDKELVKSYLERIRERDLENLIPNTTYSDEKWAGSLIRILDEICSRAHYDIWVEKTPMHLYFIDLITSVRPKIKFIHMIRNGEDVIASLFKASHDNPESFGGARSISQCIRRWKHDISLSKKYLHSETHSFVKYESLVAEPEETLKGLCKRINISFIEEMLNFQTEGKKLRFPEEVWKKEDSMHYKRTKKFETFFSPKEQNYILSKIRNVDLSPFSL